MAKFLKSVMFAAGAGIAVGLCATASTRRSPRRNAPVLPADDILRLEPLFDRLDKIETSLETAEARRERTEEPVRAALTRRVAGAEGELEILRSRVAETERRATSAIEALEARLGIVDREIPALVESKVSERLTELEARIEAQVEARVSDRVGSLEKTLAEQSVSIGALRDRALETDANLQRLIAAIEKLCERTVGQAPAPLPFEAHLAEAAQREPEARKSRFTSVTRIFAIVAAVLLPFVAR